MKFEYDPTKSAGNKVKHGIDFEEAQALWKDEERHALVGRIGSRHWTAIFTYRDDAYRIISVRHSRKEEIELYEED